VKIINNLIKFISVQKHNCHVGYLANAGKDETITEMYASMNLAYGVCLTEVKKIADSVIHLKQTTIIELNMNGWDKEGWYRTPPGWGNDDIFIQTDENGKPDFENGQLYPLRELRSLDLIKMH
jgi:hypothetical protein